MGCVWYITFVIDNRTFTLEKHTGGDYSKPSADKVKEWVTEYLWINVGELKVES